MLDLVLQHKLQGNITKTTQKYTTLPKTKMMFLFDKSTGAMSDSSSVFPSTFVVFSSKCFDVSAKISSMLPDTVIYNEIINKLLWNGINEIKHQ